MIDSFIHFWTSRNRSLAAAAAAVAVAIALAIAIVYWQSDSENRLAIEFITKAVGATTAIASLAYVGTGIWLQIKRDLIQRAFDILNSQGTKDFFEVQVFIEKQLRTTKPDNSMADAAINEIESNEKLEHSIRYVLSTYEDMAIVIKLRLCDEETIYWSLCQLVPMTIKDLAFYITHVEARRGKKGFCREIRDICSCWEHEILYTTQLPPKQLPSFGSNAR